MSKLYGCVAMIIGTIPIIFAVIGNMELTAVGSGFSTTLIILGMVFISK